MTAQQSGPILGVVADDVTGGTDAASAMRDEGLRVVQLLDVPGAGAATIEDCDGLVISLKTRTAPVDEAVQQTLAATRWLVEHGSDQLILKVCSTFDSTAEGNIGPAAAAMRRELDADLVPVTPANPENGRTVYQGHLFVGDRLLQDTSMAEHPLTPMRSSDLVQLLGQQVDAPIGLIPGQTVRSGPDGLRRALDICRDRGEAYVVVDALDDADLATLATGGRGRPLWVGAAGLVRALAAHRAGEVGRAGVAPGEEDFRGQAPGPTLCLAGSASAATREQIREFRLLAPAIRLDPRALAEDEHAVEQLTATMLRHLASGSAALLYATAESEDVAQARSVLGSQAAVMIEAALAQVAAACVDEGIRRLVIAGGETSGAVLRALGRSVLRTGSAIAPGVPWVLAEGEPPLALALKSGNFGGPDFLLEAGGVRR